MDECWLQIRWSPSFVEDVLNEEHTWSPKEDALAYDETLKATMDKIMMAIHKYNFIDGKMTLFNDGIGIGL